MGFFSGRVSFARYRVKGRPPKTFGTEHLDRLRARAAGKQRAATADGVEAGWSAGGHLLDARFGLAKNVLNDTLHFALRVDTNKLPGDLLRAYTEMELEEAAKTNPSGRPTAYQKRAARAAARARLEDEARDGRFLKRKLFPLLWDAQSNELLVGATSDAVVDRLHTLFEQTFGVVFERLGAGPQMFRLAETRQQTRGVDDARPSAFVPGVTPPDVAWLPDPASRDWLGNEYLMWLWYMLDADSDTIPLADGSEAAVMLSRTLELECPRGQTGRQTINSDGPTRLPEARRALQSGKLPRKVGLTVVRHDQQYDLTLQAESLAVGAAKLPAPDSLDERARLEERVTQLRHLLETLDLLYDAFARKRATDAWPKELARVQKWLAREERKPLAAIG
jgi:hypothetical protein